jgi:hypothetical protein
MNTQQQATECHAPPSSSSLADVSNKLLNNAQPEAEAAVAGSISGQANARFGKPAPSHNSKSENNKRGGKQHPQAQQRSKANAPNNSQRSNLNKVFINYFLNN